MSKRIIGYVKNNVRHKAPQTMGHSSQAQTFEHDKQRREHRADIVQPWTSDGRFNEEFGWLYPDESKNYRS